MKTLSIGTKKTHATPTTQMRKMIYSTLSKSLKATIKSFGIINSFDIIATCCLGKVLPTFIQNFHDKVFQLALWSMFFARRNDRIVDNIMGATGCSKAKACNIAALSRLTTRAQNINTYKFLTQNVEISQILYRHKSRSTAKKNTNSNGKVFAFFHTGDFITGLLQLVLQHEENGKTYTFILRSPEFEILPLAISNIEKLTKSKYHILYSYEKKISKVAKIIKDLRKGNGVFVAADLCGEYGPSVKVNLFGKEIRPIKSAAELAKLSGSELIACFPMICLKTKTVRVHTKKIGIYDEHCSIKSSEKITQEIFSFFEERLLSNPEQWQNWSKLDELHYRYMYDLCEIRKIEAIAAVSYE